MGEVFEYHINPICYIFDDLLQLVALYDFCFEELQVHAFTSYVWVAAEFQVFLEGDPPELFFEFFYFLLLFSDVPILFVDDVFEPLS